MEQVKLNKIGADIELLKIAVREIQEYLMEDELEVLDEVIAEIQESRKRVAKEFISNEDMKKEFK